HERDYEKGLRDTAGAISRTDDQLKGQSEALIPPPLSAVGDKLRDDALARAVSGEQEQVRLPWLNVRMPRFQHADDEKAAVLEYFIAHDRIPAGAPVTAVAGRGDDSPLD